MSDVSLPDGISIPPNAEILLGFKREYSSLLVPYVMSVGITITTLLIILMVSNIFTFSFTGVSFLLAIWVAIVTFYQISIWIILLVISILMIVPVCE